MQAGDHGLALRPESLFVYGTIAELAAEFGPLPDATEVVPAATG